VQNDDLLQNLKDNLNGRPGQPIVLGVCQALARRLHQEPWLIRTAAIVLLVLFTVPTLFAYVVAALLLEETADRTRGAFQGLVVTVRELAEKLIAAGRDLFTGPGQPR
jgi:phage shock protein PspC (stress-responsive transcriptional regulator)